MAQKRLSEAAKKRVRAGRMLLSGKGCAEVALAVGVALVKTQLLPQSELSLQSALAAYENGKAEFAMLLEAQRQIRSARQELLKTQVEAQLRMAEIERILGEDL